MMTIAYWCVLAALFLPYLSTAIAKFQGGFGPKQNHNPREFLENLEGSRKRAHWAQQNGFEVTPAFAAAVIIAHLAQTTPQGTLDGIALAFVLSRVHVHRLLRGRLGQRPHSGLGIRHGLYCGAVRGRRRGNVKASDEERASKG